MKVAIIQASSQKEKNPVIEQCLKDCLNLKENEIINFGVFPDETTEFSYIHIAFCISMLLESGAVDFVITGCSSGQGMMLACNSLPGIFCGYVENPSDAFLFGRINDGNAISFPLGLNFGWAGEINLKSTLQTLFSEPFGIGYPKRDAERKKKDTEILKHLNHLTKKSLVEIIPQIDSSFLENVFQKKNVYEYVVKNGKNKELINIIKEYSVTED